jgi:hypothetical protein
MSDLPLMIRDDAARKLEMTGEAERLKTEALEQGATIGKVSDADGNQRAVVAQTAIAALLKLVEEARKAAKDPVLHFGRHIDEQAANWVRELKEEFARLSGLVGDFQQLEQARERAAKKLEDDRLAGLERERQAELAKAATHEELDAIQQKFDTRVQQEAPTAPIAPVRAKGQRVEETIEFEVTDIHALYRAHPNLVKLTELRAEIKSCLKAGMKVTGIRTWKETKASVRVRVGPQRPAIEA